MRNGAEDFVKKKRKVARQEAQGNAANMDAYAEGDGEGSVDMEVKMAKVMARGR